MHPHPSFSVIHGDKYIPIHCVLKFKRPRVRVRSTQIGTGRRSHPSSLWEKIKFSYEERLDARLLETGQPDDASDMRPAIDHPSHPDTNQAQTLYGSRRAASEAFGLGCEYHAATRRTLPVAGPHRHLRCPRPLAATPAAAATTAAAARFRRAAPKAFGLGCEYHAASRRTLPVAGPHRHPGSPRTVAASALTPTPASASGQGLTLVHLSAQREHLLFHVLGCFASFSDKNGSG